ncbi:MAG: methyltransferase domain-containing protein [Azospirillum sp.]|nr:methyltransferase domain-containing protein [Azospirillum sp.]MCZ8122147.1 methyltransferase domain-containing protein [Magnetospirillum sp.]
MDRAARLFLKTWFKSPLGVAAWAPSSDALGRTMARIAGLGPEDTVVELGGGTGTVTRAILDSGVRPENLAIVEREPAFEAHLRRRFPRAHVVAGDARGFGWLLAPIPLPRVTAVISTLPIVWFDADAQRRILNQAFALMEPGGRFLQLTNQFAPPIPRAAGTLARRAAFVWANLPPSSIWVYERDSRVADAAPAPRLSPVPDARG